MTPGTVEPMPPFGALQLADEIISWMLNTPNLDQRDIAFMLQVSRCLAAKVEADEAMANMMERYHG